MYLVAAALAMLGAAYASVPLYRLFCQATGFGGTTQRKETVEEKVARQNADNTAAPARELVIHFNADVAEGLPWRFIPTQREVRVRPGQSTLAFYTAHNKSDKPITGVSTYNVSPMKAGIYFNKIQCFCFEEQRLQPGETIDMPVSVPWCMCHVPRVMCHVPRVMCHVPRVMCHVPCVMCHVPRVMCHVSLPMCLVPNHNHPS
ncbi:unnamed protein product [Closterium sp. Yama58-4]|nr:unnamed protein product [Closterium sp. Yama58-4]